VLAELRRPDLRLRPGEDADDAVAGAVAVALKRSSLSGRAPSMQDVAVAFTVWGFLDEQADDELVGVRRPLFEEVSLSLHYHEQRVIADAVPEDTLRLAPEEVASRYRRDWRSLLDLSRVEV
jgi:hypothetical protein